MHFSLSPLLSRRLIYVIIYDILHKKRRYTMKKTIAILLAALMLLALAACGSKADDTPADDTSARNEITDLYDEGYVCTMSSVDETQWKGVFQMEDSFDKIYMVTADMTAEKYEAYDSIGYDDEEADAKQRAILGSLQNVTVTDITDMVPPQSELDAYVGKTIGDLEADGFEDSGWIGGEEGYTFFYDGPVYCCAVTPAEGSKVTNMDDYSANDIRALEIGAVEFQGLSGYILD